MRTCNDCKNNTGNEKIFEVNRECYNPKKLTIAEKNKLHQVYDIDRICIDFVDCPENLLNASR